MKRLIALVVSISLVASLANAQTLSGSWPEGGGKISVTASGDVNAAGLDFVSPGGNLVPVDGDASPFTFFLSNTANQVTYGNLGNSVTFADGSTTELSVGAAAGADDISAAWGNGATPVSFEVTEMITVSPNPSVTWSPAIAAGTTIADIIGGDLIPFTAAEFPGSTSDTGTFFTGDGGDTGNADLNTVLDSHGWNSEGATLLIEGLTAGNDYQIQLLMGDTRGCCVERTQTASDGTNVSEPFSRNGGSVVGSFTAISGALSLDIAGEADPGLSGFILVNSTTGQLAQAINFAADGTAPTVAIPEPATVSLALFAVLGVLGLRRRR